MYSICFQKQIRENLEARQREQHPSEEGKYVVEKYEVVDNCAITEMEKFPYDDDRHGDQV